MLPGTCKSSVWKKKKTIHVRYLKCIWSFYATRQFKHAESQLQKMFQRLLGQKEIIPFLTTVKLHSNTNYKSGLFPLKKKKLTLRRRFSFEVKPKN